ncbi:hypothetical protein EBZ80_23285 [bacterium]|nr:hypothetical protein [bacterium]
MRSRFFRSSDVGRANDFRSTNADRASARQDRVARRRALLESALAHRIGTFSIDRPLRSWLRTRPRFTFQSGGHTFAVAFNTDGDLSRIPRKDISTVPTTIEPFDVSSCPQPVWSEQPPPATYTALLTDSRILPPLNQYLCGCCWALATAAAMTDQFSLLHLPPGSTSPWKMMSTTHALACFPFCAQTDNADACEQRTDPPPSSQCAGGNVADLAQWIQSNGIATDDCAPFTWCTQSESCTDMTRATAPSTLDELIPNCSCTGPLFYVKNVQSIYVDAQQMQDPQAVLQTQAAIKQHIMNVGPVVATVNIFQPWMSGQYQNGNASGNPANLFIENQDNPGAFVGSHALRVVGFDVAPVHRSFFTSTQQQHLEFDGQDMTTIPFWICANSFGTDWGASKGYVNMPFFGVNVNSVIEAQVVFKAPNGVSTTSNGVVVFEPV